MAARSGSFGGSLNPFGSGNSSSFGQYDIASNLAELELYRVEVAWGNGTATDGEYLGALTKARDATLSDTKDRESAQNRLDDAVYRIGRNKAEVIGLDNLIAFDQASLAKMNEGNLKYRSVKDSLANEMAQRRSRDYGDLVQKYNDGDISTQKLVAWVNTALDSMTPDDPDYKNWTGTLSDLGDRVKSEKDDKVYQDYQQDRMKPAAFLAYLNGRLADFEPESPQYVAWQRKIEDASKQIKRDELSKSDGAFFNAYSEGKKSDKQYLAYLNQRIDGMDPTDPDLPDWKHKLRQAVFSIHEDQLRFDVEMGHEPPAKLETFYKNYRRTLNPGSAEWRTITRAIHSLAGASGGGGGGGGRSGGGSSSKSGGRSTSGSSPGTVGIDLALTVSGGIAKEAGYQDKVIHGGKDAADIWAISQVNLNGKGGAAEEAALRANKGALYDAMQSGAKVWLYFDPRHPNAQTQARYPNGDPMKDASGKAIMVSGSYAPVQNGMYVDILSGMASMEYAKASGYLAKKDMAGYFRHLGYANGYQSDIDRNQSHVRQLDNQKGVDASLDGIDAALKVGDLRTAFNLANNLERSIRDQLANDPSMDDNTRDKLTAASKKLDGYDFLPKVDLATGQQIGGTIDVESSTLDPQTGAISSVGIVPGWHFQLDGVSKDGTPGWGYRYNPDPEYGKDKIQVHTSYGGQLVTGDVTIHDNSSINPTAFATVPGGMVNVSTLGAQSITYTDANGRPVTAYSIDGGGTWISSLSGTTPQVQYNIDLASGYDDAGNEIWYDKTDPDKTPVFTKASDGSVAENKDYFSAHPAAKEWYGQTNVARRQATLARVKATDAAGNLRQGQFVSGKEEEYLFASGRSNLRGANGPGGAQSRGATFQSTDYSVNGVKQNQTSATSLGGSYGAGGVDVGGPGQSMRLVTKSSTDQINMVNYDDQAFENDNGPRQHAAGLTTANTRAGGPGRGTSGATYSPLTGPGTSSSPSKRNKALSPTQARQDKARQYGENVADLMAQPHTGMNASSYTASAPSIKAQLPADTPDRWDGEGFRRTPVAIPQLKSYSGAQTVASKSISSVPPSFKIKPLILPKPRTTAKRPVPNVKPKPRVLPKPTKSNMGSGARTGAATTNKTLRAL